MNAFDTILSSSNDMPTMESISVYFQKIVNLFKKIYQKFLNFIRNFIRIIKSFFSHRKNEISPVIYKKSKGTINDLHETVTKAKAVMNSIEKTEDTSQINEISKKINSSSQKMKESMNAASEFITYIKKEKPKFKTRFEEMQWEVSQQAMKEFAQDANDEILTARLNELIDDLTAA